MEKNNDEKYKNGQATRADQSKEIALSKSLDKNIKIMKDMFKNDETLINRYFENPTDNRMKCCIFYIDGMVGNETINKTIIQPVVEFKANPSNGNLFDILSNQVLINNGLVKTNDINKIIENVVYGSTILFLDGFADALILESKGWTTRSISEPDAERALKGPREGFGETLLINLSMLRRKLGTNDLKMKFRTFGTISKTKTCICYIEGIVDEKILDELYRRLDNIHMDGVLGSNYINEQIKDSPWTPFKTIGNTEKPDVIAAKLLEGRIAVFVDGTPEVMTLPYIFIEYFHNDEDYYINFYYASIGRLLRILGFFLTTSVPALYLSIVTYNHEMLPTPLIMSIAMSREGVPFPTIFEAIVMILAFELLRETGLRMPASIGQTLGIVGAIVIGTAVVEAKIVSAPIIIIVSLSGICGLLTPKLKGVTIILRFVFLLACSFVGIYGYVFIFIGLLIHLLNIRSFGVPYMSTFNPNNMQEAKDLFIRAPWWTMLKRPNFIANDNNKTRNKPGGDTKK